MLVRNADFDSLPRLSPQLPTSSIYHLDAQNAIRTIYHLDTRNVSVSNPSLKIISLPDDILVSIFTLLNQVEVINMITTHSRFRQVGQQKLFHSIYIRGILSPLQISGKIYTPFYLNFTIINNPTNFDILFAKRRLDLVEKVVFCYNMFDWRIIKTRYHHFMLSYPQIILSIENPHNHELVPYLQRSNINQSDMFILDDSPLFQEENHTQLALVQELYVLYYPSCSEKLEMISKLPNLRVLKLQNMFDIAHELYKSNQFPQLQVEQLNIYWQNEIGHDWIRDIKFMFNLSKLKSLDLHFCSIVDLPPNYESHLKETLSKTTNLSQFSLTSQVIDFIDLTNTLTPNTLQSLFIQFVPFYRGKSVENFALNTSTVLKNHRKSIARVSVGAEESLPICLNALEEFDRIPKFYDKNLLAADTDIIRNLLKDGCSELKQVSLYRRYYFISRYSGAKTATIHCAQVP